MGNYFKDMSPDDDAPPLNLKKVIHSQINKKIL